MIIEFTIAFIIIFGIYYLYKTKVNRVKSYDYKIGYVEDNLGNKRYKIVAKYSKNGEYIEAENIPSIRAGFISKTAFVITKDS